MIIILTLAAACFGIVAGFFMGAGFRQKEVDGLTEANRQLRNELSLTRGNEGRWQILAADLKVQLEDMRELSN